MDFLKLFLDFILHIDVYLQIWVSDYRTWTYAILFLIIFCETGLVVTPFLPGDSLLFAAGSIAALPGEPLNVVILIFILMTATFLGDNSNYFIGKFLGEKLYEKDYRLIKRKYIDKTHSFYEKHGGKTIIIARFMPIIRTFAPFVAGVGKMKYFRFLSFSVVGNILWVNLFIWFGFLFGQTEIVKKNFSLVILLIIFISVLPPVLGIIKHKYFSKAS